MRVVFHVPGRPVPKARPRVTKEERERRATREMQTMWDGKIELYREAEKNG